MRATIIVVGALIGAFLITNAGRATADSCSDACAKAYSACSQSCKKTDTDCFTKCINEQQSCLAQCK
ncbi:MAG TPA: hypothetical protein VMW56_05640 [Candidatus Margulisiibacteriota bacterium]|nr:hypothetical protein [Candidatus Margulisiibacteriota bacterium]